MTRFAIPLDAYSDSHIDFQAVADLVSESLWKTDATVATILSLRRAEIFNVQDYLDRYPDVKNTQMEPIEHYVRYGCQEKRTLKLLEANNRFCQKKKKIIEQPPRSQAPKISQTDLRIQKLAEENQMLLEQLHLVQSELERIHKKYPEIK